MKDKVLELKELRLSQKYYSTKDNFYPTIIKRNKTNNFS